MTDPGQSRPFSETALSEHAAAEILRRNLPASEVHRALEAPEQVLPVRAGRVVLHHRYYGNGREYLLRLFVDIDRTPPVVVTLYRTSKIEKYWSNS